MAKNGETENIAVERPRHYLKSCATFILKLDFTLMIRNEIEIAQNCERLPQIVWHRNEDVMAKRSSKFIKQF